MFGRLILAEVHDENSLVPYFLTFACHPEARFPASQYENMEPLEQSTFKHSYWIFRSVKQKSLWSAL